MQPSSAAEGVGPKTASNPRQGAPRSTVGKPDLPADLRSLEGHVEVLEWSSSATGRRAERRRAPEIVLDEIETEFDGEDQLKPVMREAIETTKASIQMVIVSEDYGGPVQLDEPSAEDLGEFRNLIERGGGLFTA